MDYVSGLSKTMTIRGYPIKVVSPKQAEAERKQPEPERFELDGDPTRGRSGSRGAPSQQRRQDSPTSSWTSEALVEHQTLSCHAPGACAEVNYQRLLFPRHSAAQLPRDPPDEPSPKIHQHPQQ